MPPSSRAPATLSFCPLRFRVDSETPPAGERTGPCPKVRHPARCERGRQVGGHDWLQSFTHHHTSMRNVTLTSIHFHQFLVWIVFTTFLFIFWGGALWQIQKTRSDPAASEHLCRAGEEGRNTAAASQRSGPLGAHPPGPKTAASSERTCLRGDLHQGR